MQMLAWIVMAVAMLFSGAGCAGEPAPQANQQQPAEYLVTIAPAEDESAISAVYAEYSVEVLKNLGRGRYLVRFMPDPGLDRLERLAAAAEAIEHIQPNHRYRPLR